MKIPVTLPDEYGSVVISGADIVLDVQRGTVYAIIDLGKTKQGLSVVRQINKGAITRLSLIKEGDKQDEGSI